MIPDLEKNIWQHSQNVRELYARRAAGQAGEMDAAAQAADVLAPFITARPAPLRLLDAGCGSGYLWHSFRTRGLAVEYHGLDYSPALIDIGRAILPALGLPAERLRCLSLENLCGEKFDLAVLINTLTFCPDFRRPLDRLADTGAEVILIRDNFGPETVIRWELDGYLDPGHNHLKAYWNQWSAMEVREFLQGRGYAVQSLADRRTGGAEELVVGKSYYWSWLLAARPAA